MNTSPNKYDPLESLIFEEDLRIQSLDFHKESDVLLIVLNTNAVLRQKISMYRQLKDAAEQLIDYELIANGTGVHWPVLDEDLSLKGFLREALRAVVKQDSLAA